MTVWILIAIMAAGFGVWLFLRLRSSKPERLPWTFPRVMRFWDDERNLVIGPLGTRFWVEPGAQITQAVMNAMESGMTDAFERAACRGYTRQLEHHFHNIAILKSHETDSQGYPAYRLPCSQYCGTVFDRGGYVLVAGEYLAAGQPYGNWVAIPEHTAGQLGHAQAIADYETEHVLLAWNDGAEFERTLTHTADAGHPIIPACPGVSRLVSIAEIGLEGRAGQRGCMILTR